MRTFYLIHSYPIPLESIKIFYESACSKTCLNYSQVDSIEETMSEVTV